VVRIGPRLLVLAGVGVAMTLAVVVTAFVLVNHVSEVNRQLAQVSVALNHHKTVEEMDNALRADVARAELVAAGRLDVSQDKILRETHVHAREFRAAMDAVSALRLSARLERALNPLQPVQATYVGTAQHLVASALSARGLSPGAETDYEVTFSYLEPRQHRVTRLLMVTTARVERNAAAQRRRAEATIGVTATAALAGWLALTAWHHRSLRQLRAALLREADNRAEADLLQRSLLPETLPVVEGARLAARSVPGNAKHRIGGDWYDAIRLPTGALLLVVGDVVGHDLPAAVVMGQLRNALRAYALEDPSPASILARVNRAALMLDSSDFATCAVVALNPATMRVTWASAGHPPPLLTSLDQVSALLSGDAGPPLGVTLGAEYSEQQLTLRDGDSLVLYSDGLVERRGVPIDVGLSMLTSIAVPQADPEAMCEHLLSLMLSYGSNQDDVTCLLIHVDLPASRPAELARKLPQETPPAFA
jgi:serine phosphatase RsbU (regulator of sigma subunit)